MVKVKGKGRGTSASTSKLKTETNDLANNAKTKSSTSEPMENVEGTLVVLRTKDKEESTKGEAKNEANMDDYSEEKNEKSKNKKKITQGGTDAMVAKVLKKSKSSGKRTARKVESAGMIFMCSSKTKKDCYRYKVFGLPANKKDVVLKVYKGMRLFLFDIDLKLLYGIYKATGRGDTNIEPRAFKSAFPSQVRFTVLEDCLPLAEEKFKSVIKDNYYTKNKFDCLLSAKQVKNLCRLFHVSGKVSKSKRSGRHTRTENHTYLDRDRIRLADWEEERRPALGRDYLPPRPYPAVYEREAFVSPRVPPPPYSAVYEREAFASPRVPPPPLRLSPQPLPTPAFLPPVYAERTLERDVYRRDLLLERRDQEQRLRDDIKLRDPYFLHREPPVYLARPSSAALLPEHLHPAGLAPQYYPPAAVPPVEFLPGQSLYRY